jgi:hypothetical protein
MKTKIMMEMPKALDSRPVTITAVAVLSQAQYDDFWEYHVLPDWCLERMSQYTDINAKGSKISSYKAMLRGDHYDRFLP